MVAMIWLVAVCILPARAQLRDVTQPGDPIAATSNNSPDREGVVNVIDDQPSTKYLNFDRVNAGFTVVPQMGLTVVQGLSLTSANDSPDRDPGSYVLSGSNDGVSFTLIAQGQVAAFPDRFAKQTILFSNNVPYLRYRLIFPEVQGPSATSMQIAEVELLGKPGPTDVTQPGDPIAATSNNSPNEEGVANAIDDRSSTKYLNFDRDNAGFTVTPRKGLTVVVGLTLTSANDSPERDPAMFVLSGSYDGVKFTRIAQGNVPGFPGRFKKQTITFANSTPYLSYQLVFPKVQGTTANSMQIAEVELLGYPRLLGRGFLKFEAYDTGGGNDVAMLTSYPGFPDNPRETRYLTGFDSRIAYPDDSHEGYGARLSGYFVPDVTGQWIFYLRSDDASVLYLNAQGMDPAGRIQLTAEPQWGHPFSAHASAPQSLQAGQAYYIEALYKEGVGGDYCQVAAKLANDPTPPDSLSPIPGDRLAVVADPEAVNLQWVQQPEAQCVCSESSDLVADFNGTDGGFTVTTPQPYDGPWEYVAAAGAWRQNGQQLEIQHATTSMLNSPLMRVDATGRLVLTFAHRYSFEFDGARWDGGQVQVSLNGGAFVAVPDSAFTQNGYGGQKVASNSLSILRGQEAFTSESPGYAVGAVTSIADLGLFNAGDTVQVRFLAAGDSNTGGRTPNWEIDSVSVMRHLLLYSDFRRSDGGFTVTTPLPYDGPWTYDTASGTWRQNGQQAEIGHTTTSMLTSPAMQVGSAGRVVLTFAHRYSFEFDGNRWDGGQVRVSRNGGPFVAVAGTAFTQNGYDGHRVAPGSASLLAGQEAFTAESPGYLLGYIASVADLGEFEAGDTVRVQFMAAGDTNTGGGTPNWQILSAMLRWAGLPPAVLTAQTSLTVAGGDSTLPVLYQWERDCGAGFEPVPGANSPTYFFVPQLGDNGCRYRLQVATVGAAVTSKEVVVAAAELAHGAPELTSAVGRLPSGVVLNGVGTPGQVVAIEVSTNLTDWTWWGDVIVRGDGSLQLTEETAGWAQQFFRIRWTEAVPFPRDLVAWWGLDGDFADRYGNRHGAAWLQAPAFVPGTRGQAIQFDQFEGTWQSMVVPDASLPTPWTVACWVKREDAIDPSAVLLSDPSTGLKLEQFGTGREVGFTQYGVADYSFGYVLPAGVWNHVAFVATPAGTALYVNGANVGYVATTVNLPLTLVGMRTTGQDRFRGSLDEIAVFNRALSPLEIRQVLNATGPR